MDYFKNMDPSDSVSDSESSEGNERSTSKSETAQIYRWLKWILKQYGDVLIIKAVENFRIYVDGVRIKIYTDQASLQWLLGLQNPKSRLFRWRIRLNVYDYEIKHRPGSQNVVADALSRNPICMFAVADIAERQSEIATGEIRNLAYAKGIAHIRYRGTIRIIVPSSLIKEVLHHCHDVANHPSIETTQRIIAASYWWPDYVQDTKEYVLSCHVCQLNKLPSRRRRGLLYPIPTPDMPNEIWALDTIVLGSAANNTAAKYISSGC